jgi:hypothetical protein
LDELDQCGRGSGHDRGCFVRGLLRRACLTSALMGPSRGIC